MDENLRVTAKVANSKIATFMNYVGAVVRLIEKEHGLNLDQSFFYDDSSKQERIFIHLWSFPDDMTIPKLTAFMTAMSNEDKYQPIGEITRQTHELVSRFSFTQGTLSPITRRDLQPGDSYVLLTYTIRPARYREFRTYVYNMSFDLYAKSKWIVVSACESVTGSLNTAYFLWKVPTPAQDKIKELTDYFYNNTEIKDYIYDQTLFQASAYDPKISTNSAGGP